MQYRRSRSNASDTPSTASFDASGGTGRPSDTPSTASFDAQAAPAAQLDATPQQVAQWVADTAVGNKSLPALKGGAGQATFANCDPSTVSNPPGTTSASCDILYSDGSVWYQTITITLDS